MNEQDYLDLSERLDTLEKRVSKVQQTPAASDWPIVLLILGMTIILASCVSGIVWMNTR